ncbi:unnamed protein product [Rotaria sp. Silwood2]|nr:unnamed protein product [Rotaria sp. Silwood2]CAF3191145.1 unnamed protein product [Rotaria sp. Silwood2]CAF3373510.1 unnamed protein product [Rotaria sp. Silwood2]CAF3481602.1 unnamed protein product [Rotaria sp. Silwood2]CAF4518657.1 unnamed protein product [Rotaria sp. Silwood2]
MKGQVFGIILLTFFVFNDAKWTNHDNDLSMDLIEQPLIHREFWDEYLSVKQRETPIFTEAHRKFQNDSLDIHNTLRTRHCVPPLILDEEINIRAQIYAEQLAKMNGSLIHSTDRRGLYGENLYAVTRKTRITNLSAAKVTLTWYAEIEFYDYDKPGYKTSTGHFSQIVWKDTERLGVGYATAREGLKMYVVAQYGPPGNYGFEFSTCVLKPLC